VPSLCTLADQRRSLLPDSLKGLRDDLQILKNEVLSYHRSLPKLQEAEMELAIPKEPYPKKSPNSIQPDPHPHIGRPIETALRSRDRSRSRHRPMSPEPPLGQTNELPRLPSTELVPFSIPAPVELKTNQGDRPVPNLNPPAGDESTDDEHLPTTPTVYTRFENGARRGVHRSTPKEQPLSRRLIASTPYDPVRNLHPPRLLIGAGVAATAERLTGAHPQGEKPEAEANNAVKQLFLEWTNLSPDLLSDLLTENGSAPRWGPVPHE
jgi:hypothetical protein